MKTSDAIATLGGVQKLARLLNCTRVAIYKWGEDVPETRQYELEVKTGGLLKSDYTLHINKDEPQRGAK